MPRPKGKKPVAFEDAGKEDLKLQTQIPGMETPRNADIERRIKSYLVRMRARKAAGELEKEAKDALIFEMGRANLAHYQFGDLVADMGEKKTLKVKDKNSSDED